MKRLLIVGVILLFLGSNIPVFATPNHPLSKTIYVDDNNVDGPWTYTNAISKTNHSIKIVSPTNGVYWNSRKLAPFNEILFLHHRGHQTKVTVQVDPSDCDHLNIFCHGVLEINITELGLTEGIVTWPATWFGYYANLTFVAYWCDGTNITCEVTMYQFHIREYP